MVQVEKKIVRFEASGWYYMKGISGSLIQVKKQQTKKKPASSEMSFMSIGVLAKDNRF